MNSKNRFYGWWILFAGFMIIGTLYTIVGNTLGLFIVPLSEALNASRGQVSIQMAIIVLGFTIVSLFMTKLIKKLGLKVTVSLGGVIGCIGLLLTAKVTSLLGLYIASVILGISIGLSTIVPVNLMINNWFIEKKGLITGIVFAGSGFGGFVFSQVINYVINTSGFRTAYIVLAIVVGVVIIPIGMFIVVLRPEEKNQKPYGYKENEMKQSEEETLDGYMLKDINGKTSFIMLLIGIFMIVFINGAIISQMPAHLLDSGYNMAFVANINSILLGGLVLTKLVLGNLFDKKGALYTVTVGGLCFFISCLILAITSNSIAIIIFAVTYSIGGALVTIAPPFLSSDLYGKKDYAAIFGVVTLANSFGAATGGPVLALVYDLAGSYKIGWFMLAIVSIVMVGAVYISYKSLNKSSKSNIAG